MRPREHEKVRSINIVEQPSGFTYHCRPENFQGQVCHSSGKTYMLKEDAYLGMNNPVLAAAEVNTVRNRAKASEVNPADLDLDYLLDERLRELHYESLRLLTLTRLGKYLSTKLKKY